MDQMVLIGVVQISCNFAVPAMQILIYMTTQRPAAVTIW